MSGPVKPYLKAYAHWLELTPELHDTAQLQLREPGTHEACITLAEELLEQIAAAGISSESGWFSYSPKGYAVMYLRLGEWPSPEGVTVVHHEALCMGALQHLSRSLTDEGTMHGGMLHMQQYQKQGQAGL